MYQFLYKNQIFFIAFKKPKMAIKKTLPRGELWEIRDHRDNTAQILIKAYTLSQLSLMEWKDIRTIKNSGRFLPIRVDDSQNLNRYKRWINKKPYKVLYIRLDEIKYIFNKKSGKKLVVEYN